MDVGRRAVEGYRFEAGAAEAEGRFEDALGWLDRLEALREAAYGVGVTLLV